MTIELSTTIQVSRKTVQVLRELIRKTNARSYDELIRSILMEKYGVPESLFGSNPKLKPMRKEEEAEFHEL